MSKTALLIIDVQEGLVNNKLYQKDLIITNFRSLITASQSNNIDVIYIRHDDGVNSDLEFGTDAWQIYSEITPNCSNTIFDKRFNSAFKETGLHEHLLSKSITDIVIVGLQTEYCVDTTVKVAFELGYSVIIPKQCTSTIDNNFFTASELCQYFEESIWNNRYAKVLSITDVINVLNN